MRALELFGGGGGAWQGLTAAGVEVVRSIELGARFLQVC